jgi:isopentenyldiphosphate isomerase
MQDRTNAPDEILDLVDENDRVIGEVKKKDANSRPNLIHREVVILIYDGRGRILLQQRSFKKKTAPGQWEIGVAGHVPKDVEPLQAAHQELQEEMGLDMALIFVRKFLRKIPTETSFFYFYLGAFPQNAKVLFSKDEVEQVRFVDRSDYQKIREKIGVLSSSLAEEFWSGKLDRYK